MAMCVSLIGHCTYVSILSISIGLHCALLLRESPLPVCVVIVCAVGGQTMCVHAYEQVPVVYMRHTYFDIIFLFLRDRCDDLRVLVVALVCNLWWT